MGRIHKKSDRMNSDTNSTVHRKRFDWREDLANSRDLSKREIDAYGYVLWRREGCAKSTGPGGDM